MYPSGVDFSTFPADGSIAYNGAVYVGGQADLDASFTPISGARALLEHVARRLITPPGQYDDPDYGFDVNSYLNANLLPQELDALQASVRNQAELAEGVQSVGVSATLDSVLGLQVGVEVETTDGDVFDFVFVLGPDTIPKVYFPAGLN